MVTEDSIVFILLLVASGCDRGFGYEFARLFDTLGMYVFAGVLDTNSKGAMVLRQISSNRLTLLQMDVTNLRQVELAATVVEEKIRAAKLKGKVKEEVYVKSLLPYF